MSESYSIELECGRLEPRFRMQTTASRDSDAPLSGKSAIFAAVLGNALEFYDFLTYASFAVMIGQAFFPTTNELTSLLLSVGTFGIGFIVRPLGGLLIGLFGDRVGRKPAMLLTIVMMGIGTLVLAVTPSYAAIGIAAPIIVIIGRLIQGFALGGEVGPATAYLLESAPKARRGTYTSWQLASQGIATLVAGAVGVVLSNLLGADELRAWGWRIPFLLGLLIVPVGLYIRSRLPDTLPSQPSAPSKPAILRPLLRDHWKVMILGILIIMCATISTYVGLYMTTYAITTLKLATTASLSATLVAGACTALFAIAGGFLADRFGRKMLMALPRLILLIVAYPVFLLVVQEQNVATLLLSTATVSILTAMSAAASLTAIQECLPQLVRSTGLSVIYAVSVSVFGGTTQFVITWLIAITGDPLSPAYYIVGSSLVGLVAIMLLPGPADPPSSSTAAPAL